MLENRIAIIDLGTNTFNLLIVSIDTHNSYKTLYQNKISVKLGEGGINKNIITPSAFQRGIAALKQYKDLMHLYKVSKVEAFATSAIRDAKNGIDFVEEVYKQFNFTIKVIDGNEEAELIYIGVKNAVVLDNNYSLIMDIGGGSTEFIIANEKGIVWKQSFLLGVSRLIEKFQPSDLITEEEIKSINEYLSVELHPLFKAIEKYDISELIGSSGSFDSFADIIAEKFYSKALLIGKTEYEFNMNDFNSIASILINSTKEERMKIKGLIEMRVDMIVISTILVQFVLSSFEIKKMKLSTHSLKEGVLYHLLNS